MKKLLVGGLAVAASLGLASGSALADKPFNYNSAENWSAVLSDELQRDVTCVKTELSAPSWDVDEDYLLAVVVKGGSVDHGPGPGIIVYTGDDAGYGMPLYAPENRGGNVADISWVMKCKGTGGSV